jgi:hypothetical protein
MITPRRTLYYRYMKLTLAALLSISATFGATSGLETVVKIDSGWVSGSGTAVRSYKG